MITLKVLPRENRGYWQIMDNTLVFAVDFRQELVFSFQNSLHCRYEIKIDCSKC